MDLNKFGACLLGPLVASHV